MKKEIHIPSRFFRKKTFRLLLLPRFKSKSTLVSVLVSGTHSIRGVPSKAYLRIESCYHFSPKNIYVSSYPRKLNLGKSPYDPIQSHPHPLKEVLFPRICSVRPPSSTLVSQKSRFDSLTQHEPFLLQNPLTRGKGFKAVKLVKSLLGIPSIYSFLAL